MKAQLTHGELKLRQATIQAIESRVIYLDEDQFEGGACTFKFGFDLMRSGKPERRHDAGKAVDSVTEEVFIKNESLLAL